MHTATRSRVRIAVAIALAGIAVALFHWWQSVRYVETTQDAYLETDIVPVAARVAGYVQHIEIGDHEAVAAGVPLLSIESRDFELALDRARAQVVARQAAVDRIGRERSLQHALIRASDARRRSTEVEERRAELDADRVGRLVADHIVSVQLRDRAVADADQARAEVLAARAAQDAEERRLGAQHAALREAVALLEEANAVYQLAELDLQRTVVRAPVAGIVGNRSVQVGQFVRTGTPLLSIVPLEGLYLVANFKETQLQRMLPGQPVQLRIDAFPAARLSGVIDSFAPASGAEFALLPPENATGNFRKIVQRVPVRIALTADAATRMLMPRLRPGLSVVVSVDTRASNPRGDRSSAGPT